MALSPVKSLTLVRLGLGLVFLANSLIAFFTPAGFIELVEKSFVANFLPINVAAFVVVIGLNDLLVAILLFSGIGGKWVALWASLWLIGVLVVRAAPLEILEESGFLFMALALVIDNKYPPGV